MEHPVYVYIYLYVFLYEKFFIGEYLENRQSLRKISAKKLRY